MQKNILSRICKIFILNILILLPSCRVLLKFFNIYILILYVVLLNVFFLTSPLYLTRLKFLQKRIWILLIGVITVLVFLIYPRVDARKYAGNGGSTADDAFILGANSLKKTGKIYDVKVNEIAPTSPGPGWIIFNSPFIYTGLYAVFLIIYIAASLYLIDRYDNIFLANVFCLFCILPLLYWELLFNGHDIIPLSFALFLSSYSFETLCKKKKFGIIFLLLAIFTGIVVTSRIVFIFIPVIFYLTGINYNKNKALYFLLISMTTCISLHSYFYAINLEYQPLHLIIKAYNILGYVKIFIFSGIIILFLRFFLKFKTLKSTINITFITLLFILLPLSIMDLVKLDYNFSIWEGANYIFPLIPFYIYIIIKKRE